MDEVRLAVRRLTKRPGATITSILTLACAIGAATATWSLLSALLLRPLPVRDPDTLVVMAQQMPSSGARAGYVSSTFVYPLYPVIRDSGAFGRTTAVWWSSKALLVEIGDVAAQVPVSFVAHDFFDVLGVPIARGRGFTAGEDRRGAAPVAVLSDRYWRQSFNSDPNVVGRIVNIAGKPVTIVGVAPRGFRGLNLSEAPGLFLPLHVIAEVAVSGDWTNYFADPAAKSSPTAGLSIVGRLPSAAAGTQVTERLSRTVADSPLAKGMMGSVRLLPVSAAAVPEAARAGMDQFAWLLATTVVLLLLVGCATVGMLLLVRTEARREEFAMCLALGASRARLAGGIGSEGMLLSVTGALLALPVTWWLFRAVQAFRLPGGVAVELLELSIDTRALAAGAGGAVLAMLLIALVAGAFGFRADTADALRARAGATPRATRRRTRAVLVAGQVAVALVLTAGAGLFARSLMAALSLNSDVGMDRVVTATLWLQPYGYAAPRATAFFDDLHVRLRNNPAVASLAYSAWEGGMSPARQIAIDGIKKQFPVLVSWVAADERYFQTMRMRILAGRDFSDNDRPGAPPVAIVSESFGRMLAEGGDPLGRYVSDVSSGRTQIVGVVSDVVTNVSVLQPAVLYMPMGQRPPGTRRTITVRAGADVTAARTEIASAIRQIDPAIIPPPLFTLEEQIARQMSSQRFGAVVLGALGTIAVLLTVLGTYVLAESMAVLRTREMGIRAALGAKRWQLGAIVLAETGRLVGLGLVAGFALAWLGANTIRAFLFQVQPFDAPTLVGVCVLIFTLAAVVTLRPALRAARVDLAAVLRDQ